MNHSRIEHPYARQIYSGLDHSSQPSSLVRRTDNHLLRTNRDPTSSHDVVPVNDEETILDDEKLQKVKTDLKVALGRISHNLEQRNLTNHALNVRDALIRDLNKFYRILGMLSSAQKQAAEAIRSILESNVRTNKLDRKSADDAITKASNSLRVAQVELTLVEKDFKERGQDIKDTANLQPGVLRRVGNYVSNNRVYTATGGAVAGSAIASAALKFVTKMDKNAIWSVALNLFTALLSGFNVCKDFTPDAAAYAKLPETREYILAVADSITELLNVLDDVRRTWTLMDRDKLKTDGNKRSASELTPATLVLIVNALKKHSNGLDVLVRAMVKGMPTARKTADGQAVLTIDLPQEPPEVAERPYGLLRNGPKRRDKNLGVCDMA